MRTHYFAFTCFLLLTSPALAKCPVDPDASPLPVPDNWEDILALVNRVEVALAAEEICGFAVRGFHEQKIFLDLAAANCKSVDELLADMQGRGAETEEFKQAVDDPANKKWFCAENRFLLTAAGLELKKQPDEDGND